MSKTHRVSDFELVDHGITNSSYFQGCGTSLTGYNYCNTGNGDTPAEALDDLLESIATMCADDGGSIDVEGLEERILEEENFHLMPDSPSAFQEAMEANGFDEEPVEPDRDDFETDAEFDAAMEEYETRHEQYEELNEECDNYYYLSLRFNLEEEDHGEDAC